MRFLSHFSVTSPCLLSAFPFCGLTFGEVGIFCPAVTSSVHVDVWLNGEPGSEASLVAVESVLMVTTPLEKEEKQTFIINLLIGWLIKISLAILILG